jgi:hypothetical protein
VNLTERKQGARRPVAVSPAGCNPSRNHDWIPLKMRRFLPTNLKSGLRADRRTVRRRGALLLGAAAIVGTSVACEPGTGTTSTILTRINSAGSAYTTPQGTAFGADKGFVGGSGSGTSGADIKDTNADKLYASHRWGMSEYKVAVPASGNYRVRLHFAETVFTQAGKRVFDVNAENQLKVNDLDVAKKVGANRAHVEDFQVAVSDGTLNIGFGRVVEDPMISGIEVFSLSGGGSTPTTPTTKPPTTPTTKPPTTTAPPVTTTTTAPVPPTTPTGRPTSANTGPRVSNPQTMGRVDVYGVTNLTDVVVGSIFVHPGGQLTATNVRVTGTVVVLPQVGAAKTKTHLINSAIHGGITINVMDAGGNLYWGGEVPVDVLVRGSWIYYHQGDFARGDHTEAVAGFGWPQGARFEHSSFVQQGPNNYTATATMNWHGTDTVFDTIWFDWDGPAAAFFTVYVEGRNNVVRNSYMAPTGGYVYPDSRPHATYSNNRDLYTGAALSLPD